MNSFYRIAGPETPPAVPELWSFSSLQEWRKCPRRWWLSRAGYPGVHGRCPEPLRAGTVEGRLVHEALEAFAKAAAVAPGGEASLEELRQSFSVRAFMKGRLRELVKEASVNPRVDSADLLAKVSLDDAVNAFRRAARDVLPVVPAAGRRYDSSFQEISDVRPPNGAEQKITIQDPPLTGRLDWTHSGVVCDFKTGDPDPAHEEQLRMYALLLWASSGLRPDCLEISYVRTGSRVTVPVPSEDELTGLRDGLRVEITSANEAIRTENILEKPTEDGCRWCPVRQYCHSFWCASQTDRLRWPAAEHEDGERAVLFADVELSGFSSDTGPQGYHDLAEAGEQAVAVSLPAEWSPAPGVRPKRVRLLGARIDASVSPVRVSAAKHTEAFWLEWTAKPGPTT